MSVVRKKVDSLSVRSSCKNGDIVQGVTPTHSDRLVILSAPLVEVEPQNFCLCHTYKGERHAVNSHKSQKAKREVETIASSL